MLTKLLREPINILSAKTSTGVGNSIQVSDAESIIIAISSSNNANFTVKVAGAIGNMPPDFSSAKSVTNHYDYVQAIDLNTGDATDGDVGIVASGTDIIKLYEVNVASLDWITLNIIAISAGAVTAKAMIYAKD